MEGTVVTSFALLSSHLPRGNRSGSPISEPAFEPRTCRIWSTCFNHSSV